MTFKFDGDYKNKEQVAPFLDAFSAVYAEIAAGGDYTYNASFKGRIAGLDPATDKDEDTAIYMLQCMHAIREENRNLERLLADGYKNVVSLPIQKRFASIVVYHAGHFTGGTGYTQYFTNARIIPDAEGKPRMLMEKGKRRYGHPLAGRRVLVRS